MREFREMVEENERLLAPGSETCILECVVDEFGCLSEDTDDSQEDVSTAFYFYKDAYDELWALEASGESYSIDDLFG